MKNKASRTLLLGSKDSCKSLSRLKRLESLDLSFNEFNKSIVLCLTALPSLKILDLSRSLGTSFPFQEFHDLPYLEVVLLTENGFSGTLPVEEFAALENLEMLDLTSCGFNGTFRIQGSERVSILRKLKTLNLGSNGFNERVITSLNTLP
ncbi:hypothetical protein L2E82_27545 [Cichorium intybus]|uniref:Uncharacterized protein n=1 Tax=Cichorium intybus TaxID=13427 RepID=A0ACB9CTK8_CICIN|nr:hypothetical protein L2E82_27545 [Cichorium intybus]